MGDIQRTTWVEARLDSYQGFFDPNWRSDLLTIVRDTKLQEIAFDLSRNWDAVSNARSLPWLMIKCVEAAENRFIEEWRPWDTKKIRILKGKLVDRMAAKGEKLRLMFQKKMQEVIEEIDSESCTILSETIENAKESRESLWETLIGQEPFFNSLWSSERQCYGSIYYSYEFFLCECIRIKRNESDYRIVRAEKFKEDFLEAFGRSLTTSCWTDQQVNVARLARNALVHNGGRLTEKLKRQPHPFRIQNEEFHIAATHTTALFNLLKERSLLLAGIAVKMPEFK